MKKQTHADRPSTRRLHEVAAASFGIEEFREGQFEAMEAAGHRDVLAVMPTGHGKSVIYQVPGMVLPGTAVVVSPLIALQQDQVEAINRSVGAQRAFAVNSKVGVREQRAAWAALESGEAKFIFLAPEQLAREGPQRRPPRIGPHSSWWTRRIDPPWGTTFARPSSLAPRGGRAIRPSWRLPPPPSPIPGLDRGGMGSRSW